MPIGAAAVDQVRKQLLSRRAIAQPLHTRRPDFNLGQRTAADQLRISHAHAAPAAQPPPRSILIGAVRPSTRVREQLLSGWRIPQPLHTQPDFNLAR